MPSYEDRIMRRKRGRLSAEERADIERLARSMKDPRPGKIAIRINRLSSTVNWYMLKHGLIERRPGHASRAYTRGGRIIHPYSEDQDRRIEQLRAEGLSFREIGEILTAEFGIERHACSVQSRMIQLAAAP